MDTIVRAADTPLEGVTRQGAESRKNQTISRPGSGGVRCVRCKRFARLWPGENHCAPCLGRLALVYVPRRSARGGRGEHR